MKRKLLFCLGMTSIAITPITTISCQSQQQKAKEKLNDGIETIKEILALNWFASEADKDRLKSIITVWENLYYNTNFSNMSPSAAKEIISMVDEVITALEKQFTLIPPK